jgi:hypothetical protein
MGVAPEIGMGAIRFNLRREATPVEIDEVVALTAGPDMRAPDHSRRASATKLDRNATLDPTPVRCHSDPVSTSTLFGRPAHGICAAMDPTDDPDTPR